MDDDTFIKVVDMLAFHKGTSDIKLSRLTEKFLNDNGLHQAYINYTLAMNKPNQFFQQHPTDIEMIVEIKQSLLALSHNRFRRSMSNTKMSAPLSRMSRSEKNDLTMIIKERQLHLNDLMDDEDTTRKMFDEDEANDIIDERKRLKKLYPKVLKIIK
jgi:hypothetical protein